MVVVQESSDREVIMQMQNQEREMRQLEEMFSNLNRLARDFTPPYGRNNGVNINVGFFMNNATNVVYDNRNLEHHVNQKSYGRRMKPQKTHMAQKKRMSDKTGTAQRQETIRRTVHVSHIDHTITEEQIAVVFSNCGQVVDVRMCGNQNSILRFAFVEFRDEEAAQAALNLSGTIIGYYPVMVTPSKTAIAPVNPKLLPQNEDELEMCVRTVYVTNIDQKVSEADINLFFQTLYGKVHQSRLLGHHKYPTRIAFVEFATAESATAALNSSGAMLGSLPIRVSPSKTPVRPPGPRAARYQ